MPRRDGTGPDGKGPGTGRGAGPCVSGTMPRRKVRRRNVVIQNTKKKK